MYRSPQRCKRNTKNITIIPVMNSKHLFMLAAASTLMLTGCSKKLNQFQADYFSVNPNPLETCPRTGQVLREERSGDSNPLSLLRGT